MYVCEQLDTATNECLQWVIYKPLFSDLALLSLDDVNRIWVGALMLFCAAYLFKQLPFFIRRR